MKNKKIVYLVALVAFSFLLSQIINQWSTISKLHWQFKPTVFAAAILLLISGYSVNIISWHLLTKSLRLKISFQDNFRVWVLSNLTRFLPGKIWQIPSRIYLLSEKKIPPVSLGAAVVAEVMLNLSLGAVAVLFSLFFWQLPPQVIPYKFLIIIFIFSPLLVLLFTNSRIIKLIGWLLVKVGKGNMEGLESVKFSYQLIIPVILTFFLRFLLIGTALFYLTNSLVSIDISLLPIFMGAFALSWLLGYVAPFAPAGLGVADFSLAVILSPYLSLGVSSLGSLLFRGLVLLIEAVFFLSIFLLGKFFKKL